jgi:hypothetical protein
MFQKTAQPNSSSFENASFSQPETFQNLACLPSEFSKVWLFWSKNCGRKAFQNAFFSCPKASQKWLVFLKFRNPDPGTFEKLLLLAQKPHEMVILVRKNPKN